jgi:hypothetical protein
VAATAWPREGTSSSSSNELGMMVPVALGGEEKALLLMAAGGLGDGLLLLTVPLGLLLGLLLVKVAAALGFPTGASKIPSSSAHNASTSKSAIERGWKAARTQEQAYSQHCGNFDDIKIHIHPLERSPPVQMEDISDCIPPLALEQSACQSAA